MSSRKEIAVVGGGLAGLATALALSTADHNVTVYESRPFIGGRATSYPLNTPDQDGSVTIDNCQHVLLRCCTNLIDFYTRLGVQDRIQYFREFFWIEPGGRVSVMKRGLLPAPLHFTESFARLHFLSLSDKLSVASGLLSVKYEYKTRTDLESITMLDWLREKRQTPGAIERFWKQVLISAISEDLDRMAAIHGLQVFYLGFLSRADAYEMGVPTIPLGELYSEDAWSRFPNVRIERKAPVEHVQIENGRVVGLRVGQQRIKADAYVLAVPFERLKALAPALALDVSTFSYAPITGIHLWFDRSITDLPHATLLDRTIQWMYSKEGGRRLQLVVSASRSLTEMSRADVIDLSVRELAEFFPKAKDAKLERAHVVKEMRATLSATPGLEAKRPLSNTEVPNLFLAGDWTRSGWPAIMEGAVRSGYLAAEAVLNSFDESWKFLLPDVA